MVEGGDFSLIAVVGRRARNLLDLTR